MKQGIRNLKVDNTDHDDDDDGHDDDDDDYFSDEIEFDDELPIWIKLHETLDSSLFISNEKYILLWLYQFCSKFEGKKKFLFYSKNYWVHFKGRK